MIRFFHRRRIARLRQQESAERNETLHRLTCAHRDAVKAVERAKERNDTQGQHNAEARAYSALHALMAEELR